MNKKITTLLSAKVILGIALFVCAAAAILILVLFRGRDTGYRDILVFEADTDATVYRDGGDIAVYEGMKLQNGDNIVVTGDGCLRLLLDQDKYVTLVSGTEILLMASGDSNDSSTEIQLVSGSILNEIDSKLSPSSTYEITTPASVMAVRGTAFHVSAAVDDSGMYTVDLAVFDGTVGTTASGSNTELLIGAGETAQIYGNETGADVVFANGSIDYSTLPDDVLEIVAERKENGDWTSLPDSVDEIKAALAASDTDNMLAAEDPNENKTTTEEPDNNAEMPAVTATETGVSETISHKAKASETKISEKSGSKTPAKTAPVSETSSETTTDSTTIAPSSGGDITYTPPVTNTESTETLIPFGTHDDNDRQPDQIRPQTSYTVTFTTEDGALFAKQIVSNGACASSPTLIPTTGSNWYLGDNVYDFGTPVTADITLCYK